MKRTLAFLLVLATLLCMVPVMTSAAEPKVSLVKVLSIASDHICYAPYGTNYPDPFVYTLATSYTLTTKDADGNVTAEDVYYVFEAGASYTVTVTAYDDFGTATEALSATFTVPAN